jgi:hypothetical protein
VSQRVNSCSTCTHFRAARPLSQLLARDLGATEPQVLGELMKIMQDEREVQDAEASHKIELLRADEPDPVWRCRPQMSDHCALDERDSIFRIHELKNRDGACRDYAPIRSAPCSGCAHRRSGPGDAEDRAELARLGRQAADAAVLQLNQGDLLGKFVEQIAAVKAYEAVQAYFGRRGTLRKPRYLPVCAVRSGSSEFVACSVTNPHDRCTEYVPGVPT